MKRDILFHIFISLCFTPLVLCKAFIDVNVAIPLILGTLYCTYYLIVKGRRIFNIDVLRTAVASGVIFCAFSLVHNDILKVLYRDFFPLFFMVSSLIVFKEISRSNYWRTFNYLWITLLKVIVLSSLISGFLFKLSITSIAFHQVIEDYECLHYPLLGLINLSSNRVCWYFAEPSYLGFFLGFNLLFALHALKQEKNSKFWIFVYLLSIIFVGSSTGIFASISSLFFYWLYKTKIFKSQNWKFLVLLLIPILLVGAIMGTHLEALLDGFNQVREQNSGLDRSRRLIYAIETISSMDLKSLVVGKGENYFLELYELGVANAYLRIIIEYGCIFLLSFIVLSYKALKRSSYEFFYFFIAINSTDIATTPLSFFLLTMTYSFYKYQPYITTTIKRSING